MIATDETALICDLAETYGVYDYRQLPLETVAAFSVGLKDDSRSKLSLSGQKHATNTLLLAGIWDRLSILVWQKTKDGQNGINQPKSLVDSLTSDDKEREEVVFASGEAFEEMRKHLLSQLGGEGV